MTTPVRISYDVSYEAWEWCWNNLNDNEWSISGIKIDRPKYILTSSLTPEYRQQAFREHYLVSNRLADMSLFVFDKPTDAIKFKMVWG